MSNELWNLHCTRSNDEESDFDSVTEWASSYILSLERRLAECQAREKVLRDALKILNMHPETMEQSVCDALALPSDSTALDTLKKQWQREALLEALKRWDENGQILMVTIIHRMAEEMK